MSWQQLPAQVCRSGQQQAPAVIELPRRGVVLVSEGAGPQCVAVALKDRARLFDGPPPGPARRPLQEAEPAPRVGTDDSLERGVQIAESVQGFDSFEVDRHAGSGGCSWPARPHELKFISGSASRSFVKVKTSHPHGWSLYDFLSLQSS